MTTRVIVGITGASGTAYGVRLLEVLQQEPDVETHLVMSQSARRTLHYELDMTVGEIEDRADVVHKPNDIGASIASGSFSAHAMVVAPCSMKTAAGIATSYSDNLRVRETPLHLGHLRILTQIAEIDLTRRRSSRGRTQRSRTISGS